MTPKGYLCARCGMGLNRDQIEHHGGLCCVCSEAVEREVHHESATPAAEPGLDWARWVVAESKVGQNVDGWPRIYDWACAQCTVGQLDPPTIEGFVCVPHQAAARLSSVPTSEEAGDG